MPTEQERKGLGRVLEAVDRLKSAVQLHKEENAKRDPGSVYAGLLKDHHVPVAYLLQRQKIEEGRPKSTDFMLILDSPDEAAAIRAFRIEREVIGSCPGQAISFKAQQTYSGTEEDVKELIKKGYAVVHVPDQGKPES